MKNKALLIIWLILLIGIFTLLSIIGFKHKDNIKNYHEYEEKLVAAAKEYTNHNKKYPKKGTSIKITTTKLIKEGYIKKKDVVKGCSGYISVEYSEFIDYIPNLKCKYYKSVNK